MRSTLGFTPLLVLGIPVFFGCGEKGAASGMANGSDGPGTQELAANQLTPEEEAAGWKLLFDGTLEGWRGYRTAEPPQGWSAENGTLAFTPGVGGGDLITVERFADFDLALEWKIGEGGNSGVFFRVTEAEGEPYWTGPELQILDNVAHRDGRTPETSAGANYGLHGPVEDVTRPVGEWNQVRIEVRGSQVEHWMNGVRIVAYELGTPEWRARVAQTKFAEWPGYGTAPEGHIGLQDHGDPVWYRNVKIREY